MNLTENILGLFNKTKTNTNIQREKLYMPKQKKWENKQQTKDKNRQQIYINKFNHVIES